MTEIKQLTKVKLAVVSYFIIFQHSYLVETNSFLKPTSVPFDPKLENALLSPVSPRTMSQADADINIKPSRIALSPNEDKTDPSLTELLESLKKAV